MLAGGGGSLCRPPADSLLVQLPFKTLCKFNNEHIRKEAFFVLCWLSTVIVNWSGTWKTPQCSPFSVPLQSTECGRPSRSYWMTRVVYLLWKHRVQEPFLWFKESPSKFLVLWIEKIIFFKTCISGQARLYKLLSVSGVSSVLSVRLYCISSPPLAFYWGGGKLLQ